MRRTTLLLLAIAVFSFGMFVHAEGNSILAIYNGKVISFGDIKPLYEYDVYTKLMMLKQKYSPQPIPAQAMAQYEEDCNQTLAALTRMKVFNGLVKEAGEQNGIVPLDPTLESQIKSNVNRIIQADRSAQAWAKFLQSTGLPVSAIKDYIFEQELVKYVASNLIGSPGMITPRQIREYYEAHKSEWVHKETVRLRLISLPYSQYDGHDKALELANELIKRAKAGEKFEDLAKKYSKDSFAEKGGFFGEMEKEQLTADISFAINGLTTGDISKPIEASSKIKIIFIEKHSPAGVSALSDVRGEIKKILENISRKQKQEEWIEGLYKTATVRYTNERVKQIIEAWEKKQEEKAAEKKAQEGTEQPPAQDEK